MNMRRVAFLTSGGDCQALNATMRGVAKTLYNADPDTEIIGILEGYKGLMYEKYVKMKPSDFSGILTEGGTILGSSRQPFKNMRKPDENGEGGAYEDGRWRWMLFDVNTSSLREEAVEEDVLKHARKSSPAFHNLCQSDAFKKQFTLTLMDFANETFSVENTEPLIEEWLALMREPLEAHLTRFLGDRSLYRLDEEVADIRMFLKRRKPYVAQHLKENFGLEGQLVPVTLETTDLDAGHILLNTITPTFDGQGKWRGEYFTDYPITLTAAAGEGYRFAGWEITDGKESNLVTEISMELEIPDNGIHIKAVFEEEGT